jgi:diguanylate cyclase (GGDEF)-like protein
MSSRPAPILISMSANPVAGSDEEQNPAQSAADRPATARMSPSARIASFTGSVWVITIVAILLLADGQDWLAESAWPWWFAVPTMVLFFGLAEIVVVHLHIRGDAHTFSMVELPLALGLFFVQPLIVITAHTLAGAAALFIHRRQPPLKLAFNAGVFASSATVAIGLFRLLAGDPTELTTRALLSGGLALVIANLVSLSLIVVVIVLSAGRQQLKEMRAGVQFGIMTNGFTVSLAIIAAIVVDSHPALSWLVTVPIGGIYLANWAYTTERRRHEGLNFLYKSTRLLHQSPELDSAIVDLLRHAQATFGVRHAELVYWTEAGSDPLTLAVGGDGQVLPGDHRYDARSLRPLVEVLETAQVYLSTDSGPVAGFLAGEGIDEAIIAPLVADGHVLGALIIADQISDLREFDDNDLRLAETLASHTAIALENGQLEQSLEQLRILEGQLTFQATHDPLTGLANRTLFRDDLSTALDEHGATFGAVMFIDLDDFKTVNDTLGHAAGDEMLLEVAERIRGCRRQSDTVARLGGDEFAVLLPGTSDAERARAAADHILRSFDAPAVILGRPIQIRASIGIAVASPECDAESIMRNADTAMYQAKAHGKHQHVMFHPSMYESSLRRYNLQTDLIRALERDELRAHYQPIFDLASGHMVGAEALVRWQHPTLGLLTPDKFLHVAAETGIIGDIDMTVLDQACAWLVEAEAVAPGLVATVNVNFSPHSFRAGGLTGRILDTCGRHGLEPGRLCVEITEDLMVEDTEQALEALRALHEHDIQVALDDFGTGYSSLSQLRALAVDTIKIPKPFVDDLDDSAFSQGPQDDVFAAAIIALSRALNKKVVAEGIERPQQLAILQRLGCHQGQGYLFARPMDEQAMSAFLVNQIRSTSDRT